MWVPDGNVHFLVTPTASKGEGPLFHTYLKHYISNDSNNQTIFQLKQFFKKIFRLQ